MIRLGLTGSIGMGKTTTGHMFIERNCPLFDADACVHNLYNDAAIPLIEAAFPGAVDDEGVNRKVLSELILDDPAAIACLEAIIHPLVREEEENFLALAELDGADIAVLDIPLLFETGAEKKCDYIVVVTASAAIQRERVLARPDMTEEKFKAILARQTPDSEKRARADYLVDTSDGLASAERQVDAIIEDLRKRVELGEEKE